MSIPGSTNPLLLFGDPTGGQYQIQRSLRFNSSDSAYLSRTPAVAGNRRTWTWAGWVKRSALGTEQNIFTCMEVSNAFNTNLMINTDNAIYVYDSISNPSTGIAVQTTQVFRDVSAWFHVVLAYNTTQATASDKLKLYINGTEVTQFSTDNRSGLTSDSSVNRAAQHSIGSRLPYPVGSHFDGYLADIHFIDGQALTPSSFTEVSATTGQLIPLAYSGSFGTNGFWLKFSDNSAATAATLGKDYSGNSNNWTPNNLSVTAGAGNDSLVDTPTSYGTDTGVGGEVRGNYATLNPLDTGPSSTLSNGNLSFTYTGGASHRLSTSTIHMSSGKWYWEGTYGQGGTAGSSGFGIAKQPINLSDSAGQSNAYVYHSNGNKYVNGSSSAFGATYTTGDIIGIAFNADTGELFGYKNGILQGTITTGLTTGPYFAIANSYNSSSWDLNFGQRAFAYTAPSGFKALCDTNLGAPLVAKPNTLMDVALWSGNGGSQTITLPGAFSPDFVWIKRRSSSFSSLLYDTVRGNGPNTGLISDSTTAEGSASDNATYGYLNAFNSTGFALTAGSSSDYVNTSGQTYVAWAWDAGTSTVSNTAGSITSQVRANVSAGFSIVKFTPSGAGQVTVGHGLGASPGFIIVKTTNLSANWYQWVTSFTVSEYLTFTTAAKATSANFWGTSLPSSTVFGYNAGGSFDHIAYCFSPVVGYSSMGSYVSTGTSDNAFNFCGFRPRFLLLKNASVSNNWVILDSARSTFNAADDWLGPSSSSAEDSNNAAYSVDFLSNGFKVRSGNGIVGNSGDTVVWAAFAESPFAYSRAR